MHSPDTNSGFLTNFPLVLLCHPGNPGYQEVRGADFSK